MELSCKWKECFITCQTVKELLEHAENHIGYKKNGTFVNKCCWNECTFTKETRSKIKEHLISHFNYKPHPCDLCESSFKNPRHLSKHKRDKHGIGHVMQKLNSDESMSIPGYSRQASDLGLSGIYEYYPSYEHSYTTSGNLSYQSDVSHVDTTELDLFAKLFE